MFSPAAPLAVGSNERRELEQAIYKGL